MPFGSLSNVLEIKSAEGFRGSSVLQQSYPLTGYNVATTNAPFAPTSIAGLQVWYDASQLTGYSNGASVSSFTDFSGNGNPATQGTVSLQPTYVSSAINGKAGLLFDGVDDRMKSASVNSSFSSGAFSSYVVFKPASASQTQYYRVFEYNGLNGFICYYYNAAVVNSYNWSGGGNTGTNQLNYSPTATIQVTPFIASFASDSSKNISGTVRTSSLNGSVSIASTGAQMATSGYFGFGSIDSTGTEGNHTVCEVIVYNSKLSSGNDAAVMAYLNAKYAVY